MSSNWITTAEAITMMSKNSHHLVSPSHVQALVNRGKIGTRSLQGGTIFLKRSDVEATRVATDIGEIRTHFIVNWRQTGGDRRKRKGI